MKSRKSMIISAQKYIITHQYKFYLHEASNSDQMIYHLSLACKSCVDRDMDHLNLLMTAYENMNCLDSLCLLLCRDCEDYSAN